MAFGSLEKAEAAFNSAAMGRPALVICGVLLANSADATVRNAANLGFTVRLPADACWSCDKRDLTGRLWPRKTCISSRWRCSTASTPRS